mmetsp:Transcript_24181/g.48062  ORF Transcript_24181/g.48062 Transcript_24181/m.48062 type:complete len:568 (-) Transcript_24181:269-1972(-)
MSLLAGELAQAASSGTITGDANAPPMIHGVNLGGWLVLERYISPYLFALTTCDIAERDPEYHAYPGQIDVDPAVTALGENVGENCPPIPGDYPMDQWTMVESFPSKDHAKIYLERHWNNFVTEDDIVRIKNAGVRHVRIPVGHWITGDVADGEMYVSGEWPYLLRAVGWCRRHGLSVWIDLHTAPGSQNGFDNSGRWNSAGATGTGWSSVPENVARTVSIVNGIASKAAADGMSDTVSGFCVLNEPFVDTDEDVYRAFVGEASAAVRRHLPDVTVVIGDLFDSKKFDASPAWKAQADAIAPVLLDSHYYHVFFELARGFSPRQHIAYVCEHNRRDTQGCCYDKAADGAVTPSVKRGGMGRIIGEWSASFDTLVSDKLDVVMDGIRENGVAPEFARVIPRARKKFLRNFVEAQMIVWEDEEPEGNGVSRGWFYWNFKMEGGAFAEWNFLRGIDEEWIPKPDPQRSAASRFGTCLNILAKTRDNMSIVHEFPPPVAGKEGANWQAVIADDDLVLDHGANVGGPGGGRVILPAAGFVVGVLALLQWYRKRKGGGGEGGSKGSSYNTIPSL